jgi:asparagine synthetase B (glutamine-hydrolysing)
MQNAACFLQPVIDMGFNKSLYYTIVEGRLLVATEMKSFFRRSDGSLSGLSKTCETDRGSMARIPFLRTFIRCVHCNCTHLLLQVYWRASSSPGCFVSEVLLTVVLQIKPGQYLISQDFQHPSLKLYWELGYANKVSKSVDICTTSDSISNIPQTTVETRSEEEIIKECVSAFWKL